MRDALRPKEILNCFRILTECHTTTLCLGTETGSDAPKRAEREYGCVQQTVKDSVDKESTLLQTALC